MWIGLIDKYDGLHVVSHGTHEKAASGLVSAAEEWIDEADVDDPSYIIDDASGPFGFDIVYFGIRMYMREVKDVR